MDVGRKRKKNRESVAGWTVEVEVVTFGQLSYIIQLR
jgi:hypothetical protein